MEKMEQNLDFDMVQDNFKHFFHLNLEDSAFDKELSNLEHYFTPINFWLLVDISYFQKNTMKERMNNLEKEFSKNINYNDCITIQEDSDINENGTNTLYQNGYKYNTILSEPLETKIKSDFFEHVNSIIKYLKEKNEEKNENMDNLFLNNEESKNNNNEEFDNKNDLEKSKELINNLIKKIHEENGKKITHLKEMNDKYLLINKKNKINDKKEKGGLNTNYKCCNYIRVNPLFDQDNESLDICNRFIDYIHKKEKIKTKTYEQNKKIFSFSEKFINLKTNQINSNIYKENNNNIIKEKNNINENIPLNSKNEISIKDNKINNINNDINIIHNINNDKNCNNKNANNIDNNDIIIKEINNNNNFNSNDNIIKNENNNNNNINNSGANKEQSFDISHNDLINIMNELNKSNNNNINIINNNKDENNKINKDNNEINKINKDNKDNKDDNEIQKVEYKVAYINNYLANREENNYFINQGICCICNNGDVEQNQFLLKCEQCNVTVHQNCYGAQIKELYNWVCDACKEMTKEDVYNLECFLCPVKGGAFKKIELPTESTFYKNVIDYKHNKNQLPQSNYNIIIPKKDYNKAQFAWAHLSCALWNPKINLKNYEKKTGIYIENITYEDFNSYCELCKKSNCGPTIKCNNDSCNLYYHPECARINNCCLEVEIINKEYQYNVYCYKHRPNLLAKKINYNCQNEIQQIICVNNELNNLYELYKKVYKCDLFQKPKFINEIEIKDNSHNHKQKKNKIQKFYSSINIKKMKKFKNLKNIIINLSKSKRGRKKKYIINNYINNNNNIKEYSHDKPQKENLNNIIINTNTKTIINNVGNGNNINIILNNYNCMLNFNKNKSRSEIKRYSKDFNLNKFPTPTIEINRKEFDKIANNNNITNFEVEKFIEDKNEFIVYLIGFLNDYTLKNRIIVRKNKTKSYYSFDKKSPIYYLKYEDFLNGDIPWGEIGYKNLTSTILRKAFCSIITDEKQYEKLFKEKIQKTLNDLKKNKKFGEYEIECDNKEKCIGTSNGKYNLMSLDAFKYKILDENHIFPRSFLCPWCINNTPNPNFLNSTKKKSKKDIINNNIQ